MINRIYHKFIINRINHLCSCYIELNNLLEEIAIKYSTSFTFDLFSLTPSLFKFKTRWNEGICVDFCYTVIIGRDICEVTPL